MMAVEVKMPQLGESVHEGTVGRWLKSEGEQVEKYEPLLEVITDKVDTEVTAVESGTLLQILVPEGETVSVGTVLAMIGEPGESVDAPAAPAAKTEESASVAPARTAAAESTPPTDQKSVAAPRLSPVAARMVAEHDLDPASIRASGPSGQVTREDVERHLAGTNGKEAARDGRPTPQTPERRSAADFISPRVARLAMEHAVNLAEVEGTGRDGRITARDIERHAAEGPKAPARPARTAVPAAAGDGLQLGDLLPHTPVRRSIAEHMVRSVETSPHVTTVHEVDMGAVVSTYRSLKGEFAAKGVRLTYTAFIVQAAAEALARHPMVNSSWTDQGIQSHPEINVGLAVASPHGLIVPVIRRADEKSLTGLAREINDLAERARDKKLSPDDVQGGTFTITNYGVLGSLIGTPIINQPQAAILGAGAIKKRPVVIEGPEGDSIGIRPMMFLAMTFDHRILEGGTADPFVQDIVGRLESYSA